MILVDMSPPSLSPESPDTPDSASKAPAPAPAPSQLLSPANYWKKTQRLTLILLSIWFGMTFLMVFFARQLDHIHLFGWPLSFFMAAQGMMLLYLAIVVIYTLKMGRIDQQLQHPNEPSNGE